MKNYTPTTIKFQAECAGHAPNLLEQSKLTCLPERKSPSIKITAFVCDECSAPLSLYGANFIETYSNGRVNILRCLCDIHAEEFLLEVAE